MEEEKDHSIIEATEQELYARKAPAPEEFHELKKTESIATRDAWDTPRPVIRHSFVARSSHAMGNFAKTFLKFQSAFSLSQDLLQPICFMAAREIFQMSVSVSAF